MMIFAAQTGSTAKSGSRLISPKDKSDSDNISAVKDESMELAAHCWFIPVKYRQSNSNDRDISQII